MTLFFFLFLSYDFSLPNGESRAINVASDFSKVSHVLTRDFVERSLVPETKRAGIESNLVESRSAARENGSFAW